MAIDSERSLRASRSLVRFFTTQAQTAMSEGHMHAAVAWVTIGAEFAWGIQPGFFSSPEMEGVLLACAKGLPAAGNGVHPLHWKKAHARRRILHVLTKAYGIGGHARLVERWARGDTSNSHSLILLDQGMQPLPTWLPEAIQFSGGTTIHLSEPDILKRAAMLRNIWRQDVTHVVDNSHPHDSTSVLAFGIDGGAPVFRYNAADHVFWLGVSTADTVFELRESGRQCSIFRRGVSKSEFLPIPLAEPNPASPSENLRKKLNIPESACVLLTVASAYKFTPSDPWSFTSVLARVLEAESNTFLVAVGPSKTAEWNRLFLRFPGRVFPMGELSDLEPAYACANLYLDSFPVCSLTSSIEAALRGIPVHRHRNLDAPLLSNDDPAFGRFPAYSDVGEYIQTLLILARDPAARVDLGSRQRTEVSAVHCSAQWFERANKILDATSVHAVHTFRSDDKEHASDEHIAGIQHRISYLKSFGIGVQEVRQSGKHLGALGRLQAAARILVSYPRYVSDIKTTMRTVREFLRGT